MPDTTDPLADNQRLLEEFEPHTYEQWKDAAEALLKGKPFDKLLITPTYEGFSLNPIYRREDIADLPHLKTAPGIGNRVRASQPGGYRAQPWQISQEYTASTPSDFSKQASKDLCLGVTELNVVLDKPTRNGIDADADAAESVGVCGLSLATLDDFSKAFDQVHLEMAPVAIQAGNSGLAIAAALTAQTENKELDMSYLSGSIECDPYKTLADGDTLPFSLDMAFDEMAALTNFGLAKFSGVQTISINTLPYHKGGASSVQEIAYALATGVDYTRAMVARGIDAADALSHTRVNLQIGSQFFIEIAKFRAFRLLWSRMAEAFGAPEEKRSVHLHARTGVWNKTEYDPYVNMLRTTTEGFSAVVGGVDSLCVLPFDAIIREPDEFARRTARNIQNVLLEECDLTKVIDPAGGSYAVETLTHQIAEEAWKLFQEIEKAGGMFAALKAELPQKGCAETHAARMKNIARRKDILVGTNQYPNATEKLLERIEPDYASIATKRKDTVSKARSSADANAVKAALEDIGSLKSKTSADTVLAILAALKAGATFGETLCALRKGNTDTVSVTPVAQQRGAEAFEKLRKAITAALQAGGDKAPKILQANIGPSRKYRARADWTSAFFQAGGYDVNNDTDFDTPEAAVQAVSETKAPFVVITSDDDTYAEQVPTLAKTLKEKLPSVYVIVAGAPGDSETAWREAGVDDFVNVRVNCYDMLSKLASHVGINLG